MATPEFSKAFVVTPIPGEKRDPEYKNKLGSVLRCESYSVSKMAFVEQLPWQVSQISVQLGFPIRATRCQVGSNLPYNNNITPLFLCCDPSDPQFGELQADPKLFEGNAIVMRCDKKDLDIEHLFVFLVNYIDDNFSVIRTKAWKSLSKEAQESRKAEMSKKLNPAAFAAYFEVRRKIEIAKSNKAWATLECPVKFDGCAACGGQGKDGQGLLLCARCQDIQYCGRDCQKAHWKKQHKRMCKPLVAPEAEATASES